VTGAGCPHQKPHRHEKRFRGRASVSVRRDGPYNSERDVVVDSESVPQRVWMHTADQCQAAICPWPESDSQAARRS
jgi:hypothetical protein